MKRHDHEETPTSSLAGSRWTLPVLVLLDFLLVLLVITIIALLGGLS